MLGIFLGVVLGIHDGDVAVADELVGSGVLGGLHGDADAGVGTDVDATEAHRAGQDVYVWTLNDPAWMLAAMSNGVDGLITDEPDLARRVVERRAGMTDAQRIVVALLIRLGVRTDALAAEDALRP